MQIDWLTVAAQIVNFLVLVWLLQRFLYAPILDAMRRRETRIEDRLAEARQAREEAEEEARRLSAEHAGLEADREEILGAAREEAAGLRERLETGIREEMEDKRETWRGHLAEERDRIVATMRRQAGRRLIEIAGRIVSEHADSDLADRAAATFVERLKTLDPQTRKRIEEAAGQPGASAVVETGTAVDGAAKRRITRSIHEVLGTDIEVGYGEDPDILLGVRLTIGHQTVEWSAGRYLDRLEAEFGEIVDAGTRARGRRQDARNTGERETA